MAISTDSAKTYWFAYLTGSENRIFKTDVGEKNTAMVELTNLVDQKLLILGHSGMLSVIDATPEEFREISSVTATYP